MIIDFFNKGGGGSYTLPIASASRLGGIKVGDRLSIDANGKLSADEVSLTAYTPTTGFTTINSSAITNGGNIEIQASDPNAEKVQVLTQAEYNALTGYSANTTYIISDAAAVDMDDYASQDDLTALSGSVDTALGLKADKQTVTAYTGASYYSNKKMACWNEQGIITGADSNDLSAGFSYINGSSRNIIMASMNGATFNIYAPTTPGTQNQMLVSNGSGAPVWTTQKIVFCTQSQYDALATPDSTTLYIITGA